MQEYLFFEGVTQVTFRTFIFFTLPHCTVVIQTIVKCLQVTTKKVIILALNFQMVIHKQINHSMDLICGLLKVIFEAITTKISENPT